VVYFKICLLIQRDALCFELFKKSLYFLREYDSLFLCCVHVLVLSCVQRGAASLPRLPAPLRSSEGDKDSVTAVGSSA